MSRGQKRFEGMLERVYLSWPSFPPLISSPDPGSELITPTLKFKRQLRKKYHARLFWQCQQINLSRYVDVESRERILTLVEVERECASVHVRDVREPCMLSPYRVFPDITRVPHLRVLAA